MEAKTVSAGAVFKGGRESVVNKVGLVSGVGDVDVEQLVVADRRGAVAASAHAATVGVDPVLVDGGCRFAVKPIFDGLAENADCKESQNDHDESDACRNEDGGQAQFG